jgi:hypothetical protein
VQRADKMETALAQSLSHGDTQRFGSIGELLFINFATGLESGPNRMAQTVLALAQSLSSASKPHEASAHRKPRLSRLR